MSVELPLEDEHEIDHFKYIMEVYERCSPRAEGVNFEALFHVDDMALMINMVHRLVRELEERNEVRPQVSSNEEKLLAKIVNISLGTLETVKDTTSEKLVKEIVENGLYEISKVHPD